MFCNLGWFSYILVTHFCEEKWKQLKKKLSHIFLYEYEISVCECVWEIESYVKKRIYDDTETE